MRNTNFDTQQCFLLGGSNVGNRLHYIQQAELLIKQYCGNISKKSPIYQTASWADNTEPEYLNIVWIINTVLSPIVVLEKILWIEKQLGRTKKQKWAPRTIDIDILFYENQIINMPKLIIPHPLIQERKFCLVPLQYLIPEKIHPTLSKPITQLLQECKDNGKVEIFKNNF